MATRTPTIDCQVHCYERNRPERPWQGRLEGPEEVTGDNMVAAMDAVGVDGAILISPYIIYGYDASYALEVYAQHPEKFGLVRPFDPGSETVEQDVAEWTATPGVVGVRVLLWQDYEASHPGPQRHIRGQRAGGGTGQRHGLGQAAPAARPCPAQPRHPGHHRPRGPGPAPRAARAAGALRGPRQRARGSGVGQRGHQDIRVLHPVPRAVPLPPTSGSHWAGCSTPTGWSAASGAPTGPARQTS